VVDEQPALPSDPTARGAPHGGVVRRSGIALVHRGEVILAAAGSEAQVDVLAADARTTIQYTLPVEVELVGGLSPREREELIQEALRRLRRSIETRFGEA
jgi:hypothetical protein